MPVTFVLLSVLVSILPSNGNIIEQGVPYRGTIKPYETQKIIFSSGEGLKRVLYFQCTGSADLSIVDSTENELEMFKGLLKAVDVRYMRNRSECQHRKCKNYACETAVCPSHPSAVCIDDGCCNAEFYVRRHRIPTCGFVSKGDGVCKGDGEIYACFRDPCDSAECPSYPDAECISNYCGGCNAEFWVDDQQVLCVEPETLTVYEGTAGNAVVSKGAPPHKAVLVFAEVKYTFNLLGKRSSIDSTNTFQLYVFDNYAVDSSLIMLGDTNEVFVQVDGSNVTLEWNEPIYDKSDDILKQYCLYSLEKPYGEQLDGDWLACGHEIKSSVADSPDLCTTAPTATFTGLLHNRSHYFWVVAMSNNGSSTAYPFVRVDMEAVPFSRTVLLTYSIFLVLLSAFFVV